MALPHGAAQMSSTIQGLVETSNNMAVVELLDDTLNIISSHPFPTGPQIEKITAML